MEQPQVTSTELDMSLDVETLIRRDLPHYLKQTEILPKLQQHQAMDTLLVEIAAMAITDELDETRNIDEPNWWEKLPLPAIKEKLQKAISSGNMRAAISLAAIAYIRETLS